jgi:hypothetical protein
MTNPYVTAIAAPGSTAGRISLPLINQPPVSKKEAASIWLPSPSEKSLLRCPRKSRRVVEQAQMPSVCLRLLPAVLAAYPTWNITPPGTARPGRNMVINSTSLMTTSNPASVTRWMIVVGV